MRKIENFILMDLVFRIRNHVSLCERQHDVRVRVFGLRAQAIRRESISENQPERIPPPHCIQDSSTEQRT